MKTTGVFALAAGAAVIGLLIGIGIGRSGKSELAERAERQDELSASVAALSDKVGAMEGRFDEISQSIGSVGKNLEGQSQRFGDLSERIGEIGTQMSDSVSGMASDLSGKFAQQFDGLGQRLAGLGSQGGGGSGGAPAKGERVSPGETLKLGDDGARLFLSAVNAESKTARVSINGIGLQTLTVGTPVNAGNCQVTLTGIDAPAAMIDTTCDGKQASAGGEEASGGSEPAGLGAGTEISIAQAASLADGAVKIYLSRIDTAAGTARIAVNGTQVSDLTMQNPVKAGDCTVNLTGFTERSVSVEASC
ncbi:MAG: hypothetical protein KDK03_08145 [Rhodobacteraceae bacterium]|nr:hypothetical protein [Paracoccaceae bacterium]